ncbi:uncharacterized protein LOC116016148 [Ipomoea triloba]|uniref:uncharacterized protein LOC116016148 n=1 Tax=Ipomoea triloba TaxID=35885 RepID=UPI00125CDCD9|nr:uncharacterized protein LOC116016148 [Ipomoea triloba]
MHGIDDAQIVSNLALPMVEQSVEHAQSEFELDGGVVTQPECISHAAQVDREDDDLVDELQEEGDDKDDEEEGLVGEDYNFVDVVSADFEWARVDAESEDVGMGENEQVQSDYYDSDDPPSYQSEKDDVEVSFEQSNKAKNRFKHPSYNPNVETDELDVGTLYDDAKQFKKAMINYAVYSKRDIHFVHNEPKRVTVQCVKSCPFHCHGSWEERFMCFQLKTLEPEHKCNQKYTLGIVSQKWIEDRYEDKIRDDLTIGHMELKKHIRSELNLNVEGS